MTKLANPFCAALASLGVLALGSCAAEEAAEARDSSAQARSPVDAKSPALAITMDSLSDTRSAPVEDQLIECEHTSDTGITTTSFFLIKDGTVLSYSQMQNYARPLCEPGQPECAMGWQGEKVGSYFRTRSGALNQHLLDLDTMTLERALTTDRRGLEVTQYSCKSSGFPEGIRFD